MLMVPDTILYQWLCIQEGYYIYANLFSAYNDMLVFNLVQQICSLLSSTMELNSSLHSNCLKTRINSHVPHGTISPCMQSRNIIRKWMTNAHVCLLKDILQPQTVKNLWTDYCPTNRTALETLRLIFRLNLSTKETERQCLYKMVGNWILNTLSSCFKPLSQGLITQLFPAIYFQLLCLHFKLA